MHEEHPMPTRPPRPPIFGLVAALALATTASAQVFDKHVVVCQEGHAADIGRDAMRRGGNAVDAAVATAFALAVTHPAAGNLGGGGFLVAYRAAAAEVVTIDFREMAPAAATERMYLGPDGRLLPRHRAGPRAAGVPGTVRGLGLAHRRLGKLPWEDLVRPAARLARDGFPVSRTLARSLNAQLFADAERSGVAEDLGPRGDRLADFPESVAAFRKPDGSKWAEGDLLVQRDLADTLDRIAADGPDEFYRGKTADLIARYMESRGGAITRGDLAAYRAIERPAVRTTFRGFDVYGMGPPASGGIVVIEALNILERYDLKADGPRSERTLHRVAEALRRAFFVRATELGDPDVVPIPVSKLVSKPFADELAATITDAATPSARLAPFPIADAEGEHTTHLSTIDASGNAVALTYTLEEGYGSKATVPGAGFLLNNEMGDFNLIPDRTDAAGRIGTPANLIAPRKRMLSSQAPTIALKDGKVRLVTGSPGGRTIPSTTLWVVLNVLEFGLDPRAAVDAPRTHHPWFPDAYVLEGRSWGEPVLTALRARGHAVKTVAVQGDAHTIVVDLSTGRRHGVADRRRQTSRASGD
jgi:gamma-glutamyltranspeptidase / glutathione hydrolase